MHVVLQVLSGSLRLSRSPFEHTPTIIANAGETHDLVGWWAIGINGAEPALYQIDVLEAGELEIHRLCEADNGDIVGCVTIGELPIRTLNVPVGFRRTSRTHLSDAWTLSVPIPQPVDNNVPPPGPIPPIDPNPPPMPRT